MSVRACSRCVNQCSLRLRSPLFSQRLAGHLVLEQRLGQQLLEPRVLGLQLAQALGVRDAHAAELGAPQVEGRVTEAVLAAQLLDRDAGYRRAIRPHGSDLGQVSALRLGCARGGAERHGHRSTGLARGRCHPHRTHRLIGYKIRTQVRGQSPLVANTQIKESVRECLDPAHVFGDFRARASAIEVRVEPKSGEAWETEPQRAVLLK